MRATPTSRSTKLLVVRTIHSIVWLFFAACVAAIPVAAWYTRFWTAALLSAIVALEVAVLALNHLRCPLTTLAARYTDDRRANFDIWLPEWLARYNQRIFGTLYVAGVAFAWIRWRSTDS